MPPAVLLVNAVLLRPGSATNGLSGDKCNMHVLSPTLAVVVGTCVALADALSIDRSAMTAACLAVRARGHFVECRRAVCRSTCMKSELRRRLQSNAALSILAVLGSVVLVLQGQQAHVSAVIAIVWLRDLSLAGALDLSNTCQCTAETAYRRCQRLGALQSHSCHCP